MFEDTKGVTEAISRRRTSNTMTKGKKTGQLIQGTNEVRSKLYQLNVSLYRTV